MVVLDTDHMSLLYWAVSDEALTLRRRLEERETVELATIIVSYEEQTRGWLAYMARAKKLSQQIEAYRRLSRHIQVYRRIHVLEFDEAAAVQFQRLKQQHGRIGTFDLRIAAIVLSRGATLVTRNTRDFQQIDGLQIEDWTR